MPNIANTIVDPLLTDLSIKFEDGNFIGEQFFPRLPVKTKQGIYYEFDREGNRIEDSRRDGQARANQVKHKRIKRSYGPLVEHSLEEPIEYDEVGQLGTLDELEQDAAENTTMKIQAGLEQEIASTVTNASIVTQNVTLAGTSQLSDYTNSDPIGVVDTAVNTIKAAAGVIPNKMAMSWAVYRKLLRHPKLTALYQYTTGGLIGIEQLKEIFGVQEILVADFYANTAKEGQADSLNSVWGKHIVLGYTDPAGATRKHLSSGYVLALSNDGVNPARYVDKWDEQATKNYYVRSNDYYQVQVTAVSTMYAILNAIA